MELTGPAEALSPAAFVYCRETVGAGNAFHARMFAGHLGIPEDPATGSAVASFAGAIMRFDRPVDGVSRYPIEQGVEMGRPSLIRLELDVRQGALAGARIGGNAVKVSEGHAHRLRPFATPAGMPVRKGWTGRWSASISRRSPQGGCGCVAQLVEQLTLNQRVTGSIPVAPTKQSPNSWRLWVLGNKRRHFRGLRPCHDVQRGERRLSLGQLAFCGGKSQWAVICVPLISAVHRLDADAARVEPIKQ